MLVEWNPGWYELDQSIVVGDVDWFYLSNDKSFADYSDREAYEIKAEIISINHTQLGSVKGIITLGLDYTIYLMDGSVLRVNAEEDPGKIENDAIDIRDWKFDVEIRMMERTGLTLNKRMQMLSPAEKNALCEQSLERYKRLLGGHAEWDV